MLDNKIDRFTVAEGEESFEYLKCSEVLKDWKIQKWKKFHEKVAVFPGGLENLGNRLWRTRKN